MIGRPKRETDSGDAMGSRAGVLARVGYDMQLAAIGLLVWPFLCAFGAKLAFNSMLGVKAAWPTQSGDLMGALVALAIALRTVRMCDVPGILAFRRRYLRVCAGFFIGMLCCVRLLQLAHVVG